MKKQNPSLLAISSAALLLPSISATTNASIDPKWQLSYQYSQYSEDPMPESKVVSGSKNRFDVNTHLINVRAPLSETNELTVTLLEETLSGASPWYVQPEGEELLQVMSGATIDEKRTEVNLDFHKSRAKSDFHLALGSSTENDYQSFSGGLSGDYRFLSYLTMDWGLNFSKDYVKAVDTDIYTSRPGEETKTRSGIFVGFTYAMGKTTLINISTSYAFINGFLSDPYKLALVEGIAVQDSRPDNNQLVTNKLQIRQFFPSLNAALHVDYRYFISDWVYENANTINVAWYQNIGDNGWMLIPSVRFYDQSAAYFYQPYYTTTRRDGNYSSDYRLSGFKAFSSQLKLVKRFSSYTVSISHEMYEATGDHPGLVSYSFSTLNLAKTF